MITHPLGIIIFLLSVEGFILYLSEHKTFKKFFQYLPALFWMYFLPMIASSLGIIDSKSPILGKITAYLLPMCLFLLLVGVDLKSFKKLGIPALIMFLAGSLGVMIGTVFTFSIYKNYVGSAFWSGFAALSGSWTGGSANMIAVKEALETPDNVFLPMVVVDTVVPYVWMAMLIFFAGYQMAFDRMNKSDQSILGKIETRLNDVRIKKAVHMNVASVLLIVLCSFGISLAAKFIAQFFPVIKGVIAPFTWTIIISSSLGLIASLTVLKQWENLGATKIGYFILYFVLTSIGAKASIENLGSSVILLGAGVMIILIHMSVLLITARIIRAPMFLVATASQANVGGVASAPIVAEIYRPGLSAVGLLMAILGNIIGTYLGIITGQLCRLFL